MKYSIRKYALIVLAGFVAAVSFRCIKPVDVVSENWPSDLQVNVARLSDSVFEISFSRLSATWRPGSETRPTLYTFYRRTSDGNQVVLGKSYGSSTGLAVDSVYTFKDTLGKIEGIRHTGVNLFRDTLNSRTKETFLYGVNATTDLDTGVAGVNFANGFGGRISFASETFSAGFNVNVTINNRETYTRNDTAWISGVLDTTGVDTFFYYRYSEILPMDSLPQWLIRLSALADKGTASVKLKGSYNINMESDGVLNLKDSASTIFPNYRFGRLGQIDTIPVRYLTAFFSSGYFLSASGKLEFGFKDRLVGGPGRKWVMFAYRSSRDGPGAPMRYVFDDISIAPYEAGISLDNNASLKTRVSELQKTICVLSDNLPFVFRTFGDPTFSDTVNVWVLTRSLSAFVYDNDKISKATVTASYPTGDTSLIDCILETPPVKSVLNQYGTGYGTINVSDSMKSYRVSPMAAFRASNNVLLRTALYEIKDVRRNTADSVYTGLSVRPGSIFGYRESNLGRYHGDTNNVTMDTRRWRDTVYTYLKSRGYEGINAQVTQGWHNVIRTIPLPATYTGRGHYSGGTVPEHFRALYGSYYLPSFKALPINVPDARYGAKEFVIVAHTTGRYFKEPRVFVSRFSTPYMYVWDKIPPHITWSKQYDPSISTIYAPVYYSNPVNTSRSVITNLSSLGNVFDTYLDSDEKGLVGAVRDAGFGRIKSVSLVFHYSGNFSITDYQSNTRQYDDGIPTKEFPLDASQISSQEYSLFEKVSSFNTKQSWSIRRAVFEKIDARFWQSGLWDMWVVTEDDLGNRGMAPYGGDKINLSQGGFMTRRIEIK